MIGYLRGTVHTFGMDFLLLDVNGVGYRINFYHPDLLKVGEEMLIYTYENIREDERTLYGFTTLDEYDMFVKLISVKGLGPKIASSILMNTSVEELVEAISSEDINYIKRLPGVGAKTAGQIILDLKGTLISTLDNDNKVVNEKIIDVEGALKSLGYKPGEIKPVLKELEKEEGDLSANEYLMRALALLYK